MNKTKALAAISVVMASSIVISGCGGSDDSVVESGSASSIDVAAVPDALFAAGIECRNPDVREYKVWDTPYRELVCFGGPSGGGGDWAIEVMVFGSPEVFYGALNEYCGGRETTSSGSFAPLAGVAPGSSWMEGVALGSNWMAGIEGTSATDPAVATTTEELARALGGESASTLDEVCSMAQVGLGNSEDVS